ncbi:toxin-activating lysine-acyltransferase [Marimonas sp. MJW-29]|uniref:RTX toxin-activating lysine-acyltransferase n=1 Tax=Sulfitobacter sediminis TaxID=3234186 RepID=A0ABV3RL36_9RHOB
MPPPSPNGAVSAPNKGQCDCPTGDWFELVCQHPYCLYVDAKGKPTAGLIWAHLNEENKEFYCKYGLLPNVEAWRSGDQLWLLNVVANGGLIKAVFKDTMETLFKNEKEAFMIRPSPSGKRRIVRITHGGAEVVGVLPDPEPEEEGAAAPA